MRRAARSGVWWQHRGGADNIQCCGGQLTRDCASAGRDDAMLRGRATGWWLQCIQSMSLHTAAQDTSCTAAAYCIVVEHAHSHAHADTSACIVCEPQAITSSTAILHAGQGIQCVGEPLTRVDVARIGIQTIF